MEKLNEYIQSMLTNFGYELHLEPNKAPFVLSEKGSTDVSNSALLGAQISTMVFPLIPQEVKNQLPHKQEVDFDHDHLLGKFNFHVKKSPSGFMVTIRPLLSDAATNADEVENAVSAENENQDSPALAPTQTHSEIEIVADPMPPPAETQSYEFENFVPPATPAPDESMNEATEPSNPTDESVASENVETTNETSESIAENSAPVASPSEPEIEYSRESIRDQIIFESPSAHESNPVEKETFVPVFTQASEPLDRRAAQVIDPQAKAKMDALFHQMAEAGASDLHIASGNPPMIRKDGRMQPLASDQEVMSPETTKKLLTSILPKRIFEDFSSTNDTDFAYEIPGFARFRSNIFMDRKGMGGAFRIIPSKILTAEQLGLSPAIMNLCSLSKGLVVVTGPTGSGKSTTLCAMVDHINKNRDEHIVTIEDPIEFVHENQKCVINQREVHSHTDSFKSALRAALRQDPDIVLVGEMRDLETMAIAIETAETGHLVFGTLHTTTAASTIDRIIDQFPADRQQQVRVMLSESLKGVVAQTLLPKKGGGRVAAMEVLIVTPAISNLIREGKTFQIASAMQTGKAQGMVVLNDALIELVKKGDVEPRDAYLKAVDKSTFELLLEKNKFKL